MTNTDGYVGGIVGVNAGDVIDCHSSATVQGAAFVGGIAGASNSGNIIACYSTGDISGDRGVGGVVGYGSNGFIIVCSYATGKITGNQQMVGGVAGFKDGEVIACYYAGSGIAGTNNVIGGVVGASSRGEVTACYWSGYDGVGIGDDRPGTGEATKVDGVSVSWSDAVTAMNSALTDYEWEWSLDIADPDALPTPVKKEAAAGE